MKPLLSIIIPNFNNSLQLGNLLQQIEAEIASGTLSRSDIEVLVMDGGSTDGVLDVINKYRGTLSYWHSRPDKGQADAVCQGFELARGRWLAWQNSDDVYVAGWSKVLNTLANTAIQQSYDAVLGGTIFVSRDDGRISKLVPSARPKIRRAWYYHECPNQSLFLNAALKPADIMDRSLQFCMDFDLIVSLMQRRFRVLPIDEIIGAFVDRDDNKTSMLQHIHDDERRRVLSRIDRRSQNLRAITRIDRYFALLRPGCFRQVFRYVILRTRYAKIADVIH